MLESLVSIIVCFGGLFLIGIGLLFLNLRLIKKDKERIRKENKEHMEKMENLEDG